MDESAFVKGAAMIDALQELLRQFESGEVRAAALRVQHQDGTWEDVTLGFDTDAERDEALTKLRRLLGQLH